jgi:hypothetical protein
MWNNNRSEEFLESEIERDNKMMDARYQMIKAAAEQDKSGLMSKRPAPKKNWDAQHELMDKLENKALAGELGISVDDFIEA